MLAERAGVAEGTIYRHFKSKVALLNEVYRDAQHWGTAVLRAETARGLDAPETLRRVARCLTETAAQSPALVRMLLQERGADYGRHLDERSREARQVFRAALQHIVAAGKSDGMVRPGTADLWASVWLTVIGFVAERVCAREWMPDHPHAAAVYEAAWSAVSDKTNPVPVKGPELTERATNDG
jgi:AcrR family transcriptional regulator